MKRAIRNAEQAKYRDHAYEEYAFHRGHVRKARDPVELMRLALMDPMAAMKTAKENTKLIYGNAGLLLDAVRLASTVS